MKKRIMLSIIASAMFLIGTYASFSLMDYSSSGWVSSTGGNSGYGEASDVRMIPNGYSMRCSGQGICWTINGPWLEINGVLGTGEDNNDIFITRNPE